jgi:hypothetical protein
MARAFSPAAVFHEGMEKGELADDIHASCRQIIAALKAENDELRHQLHEVVTGQQKQIDALKAESALLKARLNQNSRNSSKPPSTDPPSTPPRASRPPSGRKPGGQPGHEGHHRELLPPDQVN